MAAPPPLAPADLGGRGTGLVTTRPVTAGETLLSETPFLLIPEAAAAPAVCGACLAYLTPSSGLCCTSCARVAWCSPTCAAAAAGPPSWHTPAHCTALAQAARQEAALPPEGATSLRFLLAVAALQVEARRAAGGAGSAPAAAAAAWAAFDTLCAPPNLPSVLSSVPPLASALAASLGPAWPGGVPRPDTVALWLVREAANAFGVLGSGPAAAGGGGGGRPGQPATALPAADPTARSLRGSALYASASRLNHDCLPCAVRLDAFDDATAPPGPARTLLTVRALHALPPGTEATLSYFPLDWDLADRAARLAGEYGFVCGCGRCALERGDDGEEGGGGAGSGGNGPPPLHTRRSTVSMPDAAARARPSDESMPSASARVSGGSALPDAPAPPADPAYVAAFLSKFCCGTCSGTLAPTTPGGGEGDHACNVCGVVRSHAAFLADLEGGGGSEWSEDEEDMGE